MASKPKEKLSEMLQQMDLALDEQTLKVISILEKSDLVPENKLAEKLGLKINATRKLLYRLNLKNLAVYTKKRDPQKKWWYLYYWSLDQPRIKELFAESKRKLLMKKKELLRCEECFAFECKACDEKYAYEDALESDFSCPKCGGLLEEVKSNKAKSKLQLEIEQLEAELAQMPEKRTYKEALPERAPRKKTKKKIKAKPSKKQTKKIKAKPKKPSKRSLRGQAKQGLAGSSKSKDLLGPATSAAQKVKSKKKK